MLTYFFWACPSKKDGSREYVIFGEQILQILSNMANIHILFAL